MGKHQASETGLKDIAKKNFIFIILSFYVIAAVFTILFFNGTGGDGDSILHFLFAKFAFQHPELFFNHWAKPIYVLLVSPFAQFGFTGVKVFNSTASLFTIFFTYKTAQKLNLKNATVSAIILIFSPLYFVLTFSGLTEPLFALFVIISLYLTLKHKYISASIIVSFLPFVRSEGLIILGIFGLYFLWKKQWKILPLLLVGHIVYSITGFFVYHDFLWIFDRIPYARLSSTYGSGKPFHFVTNLITITGVPIYILFWFGFVSIIIKLIKKKISSEIFILVFLGFLSFFIAHSLFWYLGIFNSMGLIRVMISIIPLVAIISLLGFDLLTENIFRNNKSVKLVAQGIFITYILIFPFTSNPSAIHWKSEMNLSVDQQAVNEVASYIQKNLGTNHRFVYAHPYLSKALNIDHFDVNKRIELTKDYMKKTKQGDIIIWENWFAVVEQDISKKSLDDNAGLTKLFHLNTTDKNRKIIYSVYKRK